MAKLKPFTMPKWGIEMSEGAIAEWMVAENEPFTRGTVLTFIETDKITNEVEAEADGRFVRLIAEPGRTYPVGALLAVLSDGGGASAEEIDAVVASFRASGSGFAPEGERVGHADNAPVDRVGVSVPDGMAISPVARARAEAAGVDVALIPGSGRGGRITLQDVDQAMRPATAPSLIGVLSPTLETGAFATPMAKRLSALHGIALERLAGSGPHGRIRKADVLAALSERPLAEPEPLREPADGVEIIPMSSMRRTIARRLTEAKQTIPHFYVRRRVRADRLLARRAALGAPRPSVNDYLIRAVALALMEAPQLNIQVQDGAIHRFAAAEIAVAVATEKGLVTPVLRGADRLSVEEIGAAMAGLVQRARAGKLKAEEISGGSFSLSNLGSFGVEQFDAIINPPQGAILAVGAARPEPVDDDGAIRIAPVLHLSLSCDHRAIDGADAGRFMAALARLIERPELL